MTTKVKAATTTKPRLTKDTTTLLKVVHKFMENTSTFSIENVDQRDNALALLKLVKGYSSDLEKLRVSVVKPLNDKVKMINDFFKDKSSSLVEFEKIMKQNLLSFENKRKAEEAEAARKIQELQLAQQTMSINELNNSIAIIPTINEFQK